MKLCLVCNELLGAHKNGGIGTATSHLAVLFAEAGHDVTVFYVGMGELDLLDPWVAIYEASNIKVIHYSGSKTRIKPAYMKLSVEVYEQLRTTEFDLIIFQEWKALGHACVVAKRTGLAFGTTTLATITHSNTAWIHCANQTFPSSLEDLAIAHGESGCGAFRCCS